MRHVMRDCRNERCGNLGLGKKMMLLLLGMSAVAMIAIAAIGALTLHAHVV
jgi:hypothetical protein